MPRALPTTVIFDWDNTLVDGWAAVMSGVNAARAAFNLPLWSMQQVLDNSKLSMRDSFPTIFGAAWERARDVFYADFRERHLECLRALYGAGELLDFLGAHGIRLAVCSNKNGEMLRREVAHLGWRRHFAAILGAQDAKHDKPDPAPARMILRALGQQASTAVWFVGDTSTDMECAWRAGCLPVGITQGAFENPRYLPLLHAENLPALLTELRRLLSMQ